MLDIVIIGAGPSGMSASIYLKNAGKNVFILEKNVPGGKILKAKHINNYLGFSDLEPADMAYKMYEQVIKLDIPVNIEKVIKVEKNDNYYIIKTNKNEYKTKKVLISCGRNEKKLGLDNEEKLIGKGISYCAECDGALYKNKVVVVVGSGEKSIEETIYLSNIASKVYYLNYSDENIVFNNKNIEVINDKIVSIKEENDLLNSIILSNNKEILVNGLFILNGYTPNIDFINDLQIENENGSIIVDKNMKTNIDGIYASGDIIKKELYQVITAASEGAVAAINIIKDLNSKE